MYLWVVRLTRSQHAVCPATLTADAVSLHLPALFILLECYWRNDDEKVWAVARVLLWDC